MSFRIEGHESGSGRPKSLVVPARSEAEALEAAKARGIVVRRIVAESSETAPAAGGAVESDRRSASLGPIRVDVGVGAWAYAVLLSAIEFFLFVASGATGDVDPAKAIPRVLVLGALVALVLGGLQCAALLPLMRNQRATRRAAPETKWATRVSAIGFGGVVAPVVPFLLVTLAERGWIEQVPPSLLLAAMLLAWAGAAALLAKDGQGRSSAEAVRRSARAAASVVLVGVLAIRVIGVSAPRDEAADVLPVARSAAALQLVIAASGLLLIAEWMAIRGRVSRRLAGPSAR